MKEKLVMENDEVVMVRRDGSKVQLDKLITFDDEANNKSYIIYTDNSKDANGNVRISASTDREWKIIDTVLKSTMNSIKKRMEEKDGE